jgi:Domain of Unknown Function with PDB structure (DUF3857)
MKKNVISLFLLLSSSLVFAQDIYFKKQAFFEKTSNKIAVPTAEELKEKAFLLDFKVVIEYALDPDAKIIEKYYGLMKRVHINEASAIDEYNKIALPISEKSELIAVKARSISPSGVVKELGLEAVKEAQSENTKYNALAIEGVEKGGEIEYYFLIKSGQTTYGAEYIQTGVPVRMGEYLIISPEKLKFEAKMYNTTSIKKDTVIDQKSIVSIKLNNLKPYYEEKYAAGQANVGRLEYNLLYNTDLGKQKLFTWNFAGKRIFEFMHESSKNTESALAKLIKKEKFLGETQLRTIQNVENFIKTNISLKEDSPTFMPEEALKAKYGDENSHNRLYVQLFDALGINYELISGISRMKKRLDKSMESWNFLSDSYIYFPDHNKYLVPNNPLVRVGLINVGIEGSDALFISSVSLGEMKTSIAKIKPVPFSTSEQNFDNISAEISFPADFSDVNLKLRREFAGHQEGDLKGYFMLSNEDQRNEILNNILKSTLKEDAVFTNSKVENYDLNAADKIKNLVISTDVSAKSMLEKAGNRFFFKLGDVIGPQVEMYNERPRVQDIDANNAHKYIRKITVAIPNGYKVKDLESIKIKTLVEYEGKKQMGFESNYTLEGNTLVVDISEYYNLPLLPASLYPDFQKVINASADFNKVTLVFEKM